MASAWSQLEQLLTCAICLDKFKNPRLLPCQHSFCGDACMEGLVDYARRQIKCPECRAEHRIPYQGVSSLPSNVTLTRFLELHSRITGEEPEPVPTFMEKCSVCGEKVDGVRRCYHCDKKICPECKEAHIDILRRDVSRLNGQTKRCLSKMQEFKETLEKSEQRLQINKKTAKKDIEDSCRRFVDDLQARQRHLIEEVDKFADSEQKTIDKLKIAFAKELDVLDSNSQLADEKICNNKYTWTDMELCEMKEIYAKAMEFTRLFDPDIGDFTRKIRFTIIPDFESLKKRLLDLGELKFGESATTMIANSFQYCNASGQVASEFCLAAAATNSTNSGHSLTHSSSNTNLIGSLNTGASGAMLELPSMQNALMRSQSDHRLANQFQQRLKQQQQEAANTKCNVSGRYTSGQRGATDYETDSLRSRYGVPRASYGVSKDYNNDWPRPSDSDSNAGDPHFGNSTHFKSAFMRRKEKERQQMASNYSPHLPRDYDDDDLTSEASYGGASSSGRYVHFHESACGASDGAQGSTTAKLFDSREIEKAPFSGLPKLEGSSHLDMRIHQMGAKAKVDRRQAEEEGKRDKDLVDFARQAISQQQQAKSAQRQISEDEIENQKREIRQRQELAPSALTTGLDSTNRTSIQNSDPNSSSQSQVQYNTDSVTRASSFSSRLIELDESQNRSSSTSGTESRNSANTIVDAGQSKAGVQATRLEREQSNIDSAPTGGPATVINSVASGNNSSSTCLNPSARRNLYGEAVTEKSKRQLSTAAQEASSAASYSRRRAAAAAVSALDSSASNDTVPAGGASSSTNSTAGGSSGRPKRSLRSSSRSISKQSSNDVDGNGTGTVQRRRRPPIRDDSSQQAGIDASSFVEISTLDQNGAGIQSENCAGCGDTCSDNLNSSCEESLKDGKQTYAAGTSGLGSKSTYAIRTADQKSTTTDEEEELNREKNTIYNRSYPGATDSTQNALPSDDSDSDSIDEDNDNNDADNDEELDAKSCYDVRNSENRQSRENMPNAVNKLLDRSAQIRRDSQEQRSRGDSPRRASNDRPYTLDSSGSSACNIKAVAVPKQSSFYSSKRNARDSYSTSSPPGSSSSATRQRLTYQASQSIRESHDDTTNSNNSIYTTASSESHRASPVHGGQNPCVGADSRDNASTQIADSRERSGRSFGSSTDKTIVCPERPALRTPNRSDSSDYSSAPTYTSRFLSRSRTLAALSGVGSSNRSHDTTPNTTPSSQYTNSRTDNHSITPAQKDSHSSEPTVSAARAYLSSRDKFLQSTALISSTGRNGSSANSTSGYSRGNSSAGHIKNHSEYLRYKFAVERDKSSTSSAGSSTNDSPLRSRSSYCGIASRRISVTDSQESQQQRQVRDEADGLGASERSFFVTKTNVQRSSLAGENHNLQIVSASGVTLTYINKNRLLFKLGGRGSEAGSFTWPRGVAVGLSAHDRCEIAVADSSNHRVQIFDMQGNFLNEFGGYGSAPGEFDCLAGVAINRASRNYVVSDRYNHRVQLFDFSGKFIRAFGEFGSEPGKFNLPWGVACDDSGLIYVCDKENHRVQVFDADGTHLSKFGTCGSQIGQLQHPHYIAIGQSKLVVTDTNNHRAQLFDLNGHLINSFGCEGALNGQFKFPRGVAMDDTGHIIVGDSGNNRVQIFRMDGTFVKTIGTWGSADGEFKGIEGVAVDSSYNILVCDRENHRIQIF